MPNQNQAKQFNEITPVGNVVSASPFHVITYQEVLLSTNLDDKEVYKQGSIKDGESGEYVYTFAPTDLGLQKLMNAAGIRGTPERIDDRSHPHLCTYRFHGEWTQPDSTVLSFPTDYELDLRGYIRVGEELIKGARFEQQYKSELGKRTELRFKAELKALKWGSAERQTKADQLFRDLPAEEQGELRQVAEGVALSAIEQMRVHIVSRAQTGAKERFVRKVLGLKNAYTMKELALPFRIPRSEFRFDKMVEQLGPEMARPLLEAKAAAILGISPEQLAKFKQLPAPQPAPVHPSHAEPEVVDTTWKVGPDFDSPITSRGSVVDASDQAQAATGGGTSTSPVSVTKTVTKTAEVKNVENVASVVTPLQPANGKAEPSETNAVLTVSVGGKQKPAQALIGAEVAKSEWFKKEVLDNKYFKARAHFKQHIKSHFGRGSESNITWGMLRAMLDHINAKVDTLPWYGEVTHEGQELALEAKFDKYGAGGLYKSLVEKFHIVPSSALAVEMFENILTGLAEGLFTASTDEGQAYITDLVGKTWIEIPF